MNFLKLSFEKYLTQAYRKLHKKQELFMQKYSIDNYDSWNYNQASGVLVFSNKNDDDKKFFSFQCIGSYAPKAGTWLWSWANNNTYPNIKTASFDILEFGKKRKYEALTESSWNAEEIDGWEMSAIALDIVKPLGIYLIPTEEVSLFLMVMEELTQEEAEYREANEEQIIECKTHGIKRPTFVCQHLNLQEKRGFHEAFETSKNMELLEDDDFQAWCDECEQMRLKHNGWNEESEKFAEIKLICEDCYFEIKAINDNSSFKE